MLLFFCDCCFTHCLYSLPKYDNTTSSLLQFKTRLNASLKCQEKLQSILISIYSLSQFLFYTFNDNQTLIFHSHHVRHEEKNADNVSADVYTANWSILEQDKEVCLTIQAVVQGFHIRTKNYIFLALFLLSQFIAFSVRI